MKPLLAKILILVPAFLVGSTPAAYRPPAEATDTSQALSRPETLVVAGDIPARQRDVMLSAAARFYTFWNTGDEALLHQVVSDRFFDHTLPPGRPQGPAGPAAASKAFLAAVPDLKVVVTQQMLVGDRVVSHLHFTGHFTGRFKGTQGAGQSIHGRIFLVLARIDGSDGPRVAEWVDGKPKPYPDRAWNGWSKGKPAEKALVRVNTLRIGPDGDLWLMDVGALGLGNPKLPGGPKLVRIDPATNTVRRVYSLDAVTS